MSDFGDLFGGIGEFISGLTEGGGEVAVGGFVEKSIDSMGDDGEDADAAVDRYLTGGPRLLNVNDI
jgi:hypothetical protein